jgi:hypothetical protein
MGDFSVFSFAVNCDLHRNIFEIVKSASFLVDKLQGHTLVQLRGIQWE